MITKESEFIFCANTFVTWKKANSHLCSKEYIKKWILKHNADTIWQITKDNTKQKITTNSFVIRNIFCKHSSGFLIIKGTLSEREIRYSTSAPGPVFFSRFFENLKKSFSFSSSDFVSPAPLTSLFRLSFSVNPFLAAPSI